MKNSLGLTLIPANKHFTNGVWTPTAEFAAIISTPEWEEFMASLGHNRAGAMARARAGAEAQLSFAEFLGEGEASPANEEVAWLCECSLVMEDNYEGEISFYQAWNEAAEAGL